MASVSPIKLSKPKKGHNNQMKPPKQYFDLYLHGQEEVRTGVCFSSQKHKILDETSKSGVCFSSQKHKILDEISKSQHDQGCIIKKVKLNEENTDFVLTDFTTTTKSKLAYNKAEHQLNFMLVAW